MAQREESIQIVTPMELMQMLLQFPEDLSLMIWGPPGIGKSEIVFEASQELRYTEELGYDKSHPRYKTAGGFWDIRLPQMQSVDIRGLPVISTDRSSAKFLAPDEFPREDRDGDLGIFFLDELPSATPNVQVAAYQLILNRQVGQYKLPRKVKTVAAGNRVTDRGVAYRMGTALANRMFHVQLEPNTPEWISWAMNAKINSLIIAYIARHPTDLFKFNPDSESVAWASPRSWTKASRALESLKTEDLQNMAVSAAVGMAAGLQFKQFRKMSTHLPPPEEILRGAKFDMPNNANLDLIFTLGVGISAVVEKATVDRYFQVVQMMPADFQTATIQMAASRKELISVLLPHKEFTKYSKEVLKFLKMD